MNSAAVSALLARKSRRVKSARDAPVPIRFVIVVSGWAPLGTSAVDRVKTKKPPVRSLRVRPSGIAY
ncbi:hypothetical protein [Mesorhizobium sp.]|uniref:hypothetical protein n=1 Tax=Mesorhizobium sp. TaxID=1871066 RepID=UPI00257A159C|nr:hypothetical protein [Mesorhizobium sp.]